MIRFLAEIALRSPSLIQPTPSNDVSRTLRYPLVIGQRVPTGIYYVDISSAYKTTDEYWGVLWGGTYDQYVDTQIDLYYSQFLQHVNNMAELFSTPYSLYIDTSTYHVYLNIPHHPWLYADYAAEGENVLPFISSALVPDRPADNKIRGVAAPTRLEIPNFTVKLSDNISGTVLNQSFSLNFHNNDGYFDSDDLWDLFNTPVRLKKSVVENPSYEDFREIRSGTAEDTRTTFDTFSIAVSDKLRGMSEPVCGVIRQSDFPDTVLIADAIGKNIPVVYGSKRVDLVKISESPELYIAAENPASLSAVYDKDGNTIPGTLNTNGTISATDAKTALVTGYTPNNIGEVIKDLIGRKTAIQYNGSNWNTDEIADYIAIAADVNIAFTTGDIKKAIQDVLKSDMAYFIQQMDGRFTIRKYGESYGHHIIRPWTITQKPDKNFDKAQANYFSSCTINYNHTTKEEFDTYFFEEMENDAEDRYRKKVFKTYDTDLVNQTDAEAIARLLGTRYTIMRQTLKLALGIDTSEMELLDTVTIGVEINGRPFSNSVNFIITEINPAQDVLTLEEIDNNLDVTGEYPDTTDYMTDFDNMYANTKKDEFDFELDGGAV